jgi:hypothetical protein
MYVSVSGVAKGLFLSSCECAAWLPSAPTEREVRGTGHAWSPRGAVR